MHGATQQEWTHFSLILGLTEDLLPVVSNPALPISPHSKMSAVGKTPSQLNPRGEVVGFPQWTQYRATGADIAKWREVPDLGLCIQTRTVRALDIDVDDIVLATKIRQAFCAELGVSLPVRARPNSGKVLLAFEITGSSEEFYKRKFAVPSGIVEFLATGQQFVACGTHTSGVRYEWNSGTLPDEIPLVNQTAFNKAWSSLLAQFAIEDETKATAPVKGAKLATLHASDPVSQRLADAGMVLSVERDGKLNIVCPFEDEHTGVSAESSTSYWPPNTGGFSRGHFHCLHAHCAHRTDADFEEAIGFSIGDDFEDISGSVPPAPTSVPPLEAGEGDALRFAAIPAKDFVSVAPTPWLIKHVVPRAELVVMYGDSGSGKSFMALDMGCAIALGEPWRGEHKVTKGRVIYVAAEGAAGCRMRVRAYAQHHGLALSNLDVLFIPAAPSFLSREDVVDLLAAIQAAGGADLVIVDTLAQVTAGANENSGEDMGRAIKFCRLLHEASKATIMLIHHSGKNAAAGARGWSGLRAAADAELEVLRSDEDRVMTVTKQKDGRDGQEFGFRLVVHELGEDEDNEPITSCTVAHTAAVSRHSISAPGRAEAKVLDLISLLHETNKVWPWVEELRRLVKKDHPELLKNFKRVIESLVDKELVRLSATDRIELTAAGPVVEDS